MHSVHLIKPVLVCFVVLEVCHALPECVPDTVAGQSSVMAASVFTSDIHELNSTILMSNSLYTLDCCGYISKWEVVTGGEGHVRMQVWRPVKGSPGIYILLGHNAFHSRTSDIKKRNFPVPERSRVHVQSGDIIAIQQLEQAVVRYITCDQITPADPSVCAEDNLISPDVYTTDKGYQLEFVRSQADVLGVNTYRAYAVTAILQPCPSPSCEDKEKTITDLLKAGDQVTSVRYANYDTFHENSSIAIQSTDPFVPVTITQNGEMLVSGVLDPSYPSEVYNVTVHMTDGRAGMSSTCVVTLTVKNEPKAIVFNGLPSANDAVVAENIYSFSLSRQRDIDDVTCDIIKTTPDTQVFEIIALTKTDYTIRSKSEEDVTSLFLSTDIIMIEIKCNNSAGNVNQSSLVLLAKGHTGKGGFVVMSTVLAFLVLLGFVFVVLTILHQKGFVKIWPGQTKVEELGSNSSTNGWVENNNVDSKPTSGHKGLESKDLHMTFSDHNTSGNSVNKHESFRFWGAPLVRSPNAILLSEHRSGTLLQRTSSEKGIQNGIHHNYHHKKPWIP